MKCPFCYGETKHRICDYCGSELPESIVREFVNFERPAYEPMDSVRRICKIAVEINYDHNEGDFFARSWNGTGQMENKYTFYDMRLLHNLNIAEDEEVFLGHDSSFWGNGKCGFAFTRRGIHFKSDEGKYTFLSWYDFATKGEISKYEFDYYVGSTKFASFISSDEAERAFYELVKKLQRACQYDTTLATTREYSWGDE